MPDASMFDLSCRDAIDLMCILTETVRLVPLVPMQIWVDEYADYGTSSSYLQPTAKETLRQSWLASKPTHQFWWYWCIGPADPKAMNTFIERPAIQARLRE